MSFDALSICINIKDIKPISKLVLLVLANYSNEDFQSYPSKSKLSELCNADEQTIARALQELIQKEIIKCQSRYLGKKQISNLYTIQTRGIKNKGGIKFRGGKNEPIPPSNLPPNTIIDTKIKVRNEYSPEFEVFWKLYPKREDGQKLGKYETFLEFKKCKDKNILLDCVKNYNDYKKGKFINNPCNFLKKKIYLDFKNKKTINKTLNHLAG